MPMESHLKTNTLKKFIVPITLGIIIILYILVEEFNCKCIFKTIFNINCPACGMTRALKQILKFNIINSFKYNILAVPLIILTIIEIILYIIDIKNKKQYFDKFNKKITDNYKILIIILLLNMLINNIRNI